MVNIPAAGTPPAAHSLRKAALQAVAPVFRLELSTLERLGQHGQIVSWGVTLVALLGALFIPWERVPFGPRRWIVTPDSLNATLIGLWMVEATLFVLTAAITALLIGLFTEPTSRLEVMGRYRRNAFDAAAAFALFALVYTGALIVVVLGGESDKTWGFGHWLSAGAAIFVIDLLELAWLLQYTHQLLGEPPRSQTLRWTLALRTSFLEHVVARMARALLVSWAAPRHLVYEDFGSAPGQGRAGLVTEQSAYVQDVRLNKLEAWVRQSYSVTTQQPARWQFWRKAVPPAVDARPTSLRIYLNARVVRGTRLAWVDPRSITTSRQLNRSVAWTSNPPADPFPDALNQMRDRAIAAAQNGQMGALEQIQDAFESVYDETLRIETRISALPNPPVPPIFGWQPHTQLRIAIHRLGSEVLTSPSEFLINQWLYFVQELLRILRPYSGIAGEVMHLWAIAGSGPSPPEQLMLRFREYVAELNTAWREASTIEDLNRRLAEVLSFLGCLRSIWAYGRPENRPQLRNVLAAVDDFIDPFPSGVQPTAIDQHRLACQTRVRAVRRCFWFGAGVWLTGAVGQNRIAVDAFDQLWDHDIVPGFQRPEQVWEAWSDYVTADVVGWCQLRGSEEAGERRAQGQHHAFAGPNDDVVSAPPALALMLRHANFAGMPRTPNDQIQFQSLMWHAAETIFRSEMVPWPQIAEHLPVDSGTRFQDLRDAVM